MFPGLGYQKRIATIGGTFDALHQGHKEYIKVALEFSDYTIIYLSTDEYAKWKKGYQIKPYEERHKSITQFVQQIGCHDKCEIRPHSRENDFAIAYLSEFTCQNILYMAIVSPQYYEKFCAINRLRETYGMASIILIVKQRLRDLSSSAIRGVD